MRETLLGPVQDFEDFWSLYPPRGRTPRRTKKREARAAWDALKPQDRIAAFVGLQVAVATRDWLEPRYIPEAHRWLRKRRWEDEAPSGDQVHSPKERKMLRTWRSRVGGNVCPPDHGEEQCGSVEDCNEKQLVRWTKRGLL